jgi:hypothetical protein
MRDGPPVAIGCTVTITVRRPLLLLLCCQCRHRRCLTIDVGDSFAAGGTGLAPPRLCIPFCVPFFGFPVPGILGNYFQVPAKEKEFLSMFLFFQV